MTAAQAATVPASGRRMTEGHLLGGRVQYVQPAEGFRTGIEPVLLAASIAAKPGQRVLEGGSGSGAGLLCLAARVQDLEGVGVERDAALAALAAANAAANRFSGLSFLAAPLESADPPGPFDHAMANPPYHPSGGSVSPDPGRDSAKRARTGLFAVWTERLSRGLRRHGSLTLILPPARLAECLEAMQAANCAATAVMPLWPKAGRMAGLVLVQGRRFSRSPLRMLPGIVLHQADGGFTPQVEAILRGSAALEWE